MYDTTTVFTGSKYPTPISFNLKVKMFTGPTVLITIQTELESIWLLEST